MDLRELNKDKILKYADFYDYYDEKELEKEKTILEKVKSVNSTGNLFNLILEKEGILDWKGVLRIKGYFEDTNYWTQEKKEEFLKILKQKQEPDNDSIKNKDIVNKIALHPGIKFPIASTIVYFFSEGNCPIIDVRAVKTLRIYKYNVKDSYDWDNYFDVCKKITDDCGVSFRQLDKALWIYPDIETNLLNCKKLNDLNITHTDLPLQL